MLLDDVWVTIYDNVSEVAEPSNKWNQTNWVTFTGLIHSVQGVKINVTSFIDSRFGIEIFEGKTSVEIIWDRVDFFMSLADKFGRPWSSSLRYNVKSSAFVLIQAYYVFDQTPFNGNLTLFHRTYSEWKLEPVYWNNHTLIEIPYDSTKDGPDRVLFEITNITHDIHGFEGYTTFQVFVTGAPTSLSWLNLYWDRIIIEFNYEILDEDFVIPGAHLNVTMDAYYQDDRKPVQNLIYNLTKNDVEFYEINRSQLFFLDTETREVNNTYKIIDAYDPLTNLFGAFSIEAIPDPLTNISWVDSVQPPQLLDQSLIDLGNGFLVFYVETTDDELSGKYFGSGVDRVSVQLAIEGVPPSETVHYLDYSSYRIRRVGNVSIFSGIVKTDSTEPRDDFSYGETLVYKITLMDKRQLTKSYEFSATLTKDSDAPTRTGFELRYSSNLDGNIMVVVNAIDAWSGIDRATIHFFDSITNQSRLEQNMNNRSLESGEIEFWSNLTFSVGDILRYKINIYDTYGNIDQTNGLIEILDESAPYLESCTINYTEFGEFSIIVTVGDNGSPVSSAILYYYLEPGVPTSVNLTESLGGGGSSISRNGEFIHSKTFSADFTIPTSLLETTFVRFKLNLTDSSGNIRSIRHEELSQYILGITATIENVEIPSNAVDLMDDPIVLLVIISVMLSIALVAIQRFKTIGGFDKKKIIDDLEKISENEVWEKNDRISIGLVSSFFDQVKGPIPLIVYPEKLRSSEAMLANLSDRSFSTLGFVSNPEEDKHAIFRFQIGGEKCAVFGYAFAFENPEARGGQENLSLCFVIRPPYGNLENLNKFLTELVEHSQQIRKLMKEQADVKVVEKEMEKTRNFFTRSMLLFRRKYKKEFIE